MPTFTIIFLTNRKPAGTRRKTLLALYLQLATAFLDLYSYNHGAYVRMAIRAKDCGSTRLDQFALMCHPWQPFRAGPVPLLTPLDAFQGEQESLLISSIRVIPQSGLQLWCYHMEIICHHLAPQLSNAGYARDAVKRQHLDQLGKIRCLVPQARMQSFGVIRSNPVSTCRIVLVFYCGSRG